MNFGPTNLDVHFTSTIKIRKKKISQSNTVGPSDERSILELP